MSVPTPSPVPAIGTRRPLFRLFREYAWHHRVAFALGVAFLGLTNWLTVTIPGEIGEGIDALRAGSTDVAIHAGHVAWMGIAIIFVRTLSRVLFFNPGRDIEYRIRSDIFARLLEQQPSFYASRRTGDIVSRASNDITWTRAMVGFGLMQAVNVTFAVVLTGWKMVALSLELTIAVLVPVLVGLVGVQAAIRMLFRLEKRNQQQLGRLSDQVLDSFQGIATIQGFVAEEAFIERFDVRNRDWFHTRMRIALVASLAIPVLALTGGLAIFLLIYVGGPMALAGALTVGDLAAFVTLVAALLPPLRSLGWMLSVWQRGVAALERIFEVLDAPVDRPEHAGRPVVLKAGRGPSISLRGLSFAYPDAPDRPVLHDLEIDLPAGAVVGVFGRTGSGKSTLLRVLARLYNPPEGAVFVDGVDLTRLDLDHWRERLAVVPQRPFLFSDTIAENVALDDLPADDVRRWRAIDRAVALAALDPDLKALPDGLDTVVGERGILLSGGQRQRVALARGLYKDADLVLLDDVLSAVDHATEARLVRTLRELSAGGRATVFLVSHRISAIRHADVILVLDDGRLVDTGTHAELVERPGFYRDMWRVQRHEAEDGVQTEASGPSGEVAK